MLDKKTEKNIYNMIKYADTYSKFYHKKFIQKAVNMRYLNLEALPVVTKEEFTENYDEVLTDSCEDVVKEYTSGSTGIPLVCQKSKKERVMGALAIWRRRKQIDPEVNVNNYVSVWRDSYLRKSIMEINHTKIVESLNYILEKKPRWISGPVTILQKYAMLIENGELSYDSEVCYIELMGEFVSQEHREYLEKVFRCKTVILYGTRESWAIAYECKFKNLHILEEQVFVEILDENEQPTEGFGNVVITSLYNRRMPLIRYNTYDIGKKTEDACPCGCTGSILKLNGGRVMDIIRGKDIIGSIFFGRISSILINKYPNSISAFKVIQMDFSYFTFYIVPGKLYETSILDTITQLVQMGLGEDVIIDFLIVESIPINKSGKLKIFEVAM